MRVFGKVLHWLALFRRRNMTDFTSKKILITGGAGFLGSHLIENLVSKRGISRENIVVPLSSEFDLREWKNCKAVVEGADVIFHLAAFVGGIGFNQVHPGRMFYDNMVMGAQLMEAARQAGVEKCIVLGTICAYPKYTPVPFREETLWEGYPEETNAPYGLAKKALLVQAQSYRKQYGLNAIYLLPVNLYGPRDNFDPRSSHVIPALIRKFAEAIEQKKEYVEVWGTGRASREFLYVQDAAEGILLAAENYDGSDPVNIGSGMEITIKDLVQTIAQLMKFEGEIRWDFSKPDGQPRRRLDVSRAEKEFGFRASTSFEDGLRATIDWYLKNNHA